MDALSWLPPFRGITVWYIDIVLTSAGMEHKNGHRLTFPLRNVNPNITP